MNNSKGMKNCRVVFLGQGVNASKTLEKLNKNKLVNIIFCAPRIDNKENYSWFDNGTLSNKANELRIKVVSEFNLNSKKFVELVKKASRFNS